MIYHPEKKLVILAEGSFSSTGSKTATGIIRYGNNPILAVLDSTKAGKTAGDIVGAGFDIPILASLDEVEERVGECGDVLAIGIAPRGGALPEPWKATLFQAFEKKMDIWNGLHLMMSEIPELASRAEKSGSRIWDVRKPADDIPVSSGFARNVDAHVVLSVGSDCNVGKMTAVLELEKAAIERGRKAVFCPTGQTGIMIKGWGVPVDRLIGDFIAGGAERLVLEAADEGDLILVEGQGSLAHPGYSGVTLGLLHGSMPDHMLLCYRAGDKEVGVGYGVPVPSASDMIRYLEVAAEPVKPAPVIGIVVNTFHMDEDDARREMERVEKETGLPADDVVRFGPDKILDVVLEAGKSLDKKN